MMKSWQHKEIDVEDTQNIVRINHRYDDSMTIQITNIKHPDLNTTVDIAKWGGAWQVTCYTTGTRMAAGELAEYASVLADAAIIGQRLEVFASKMNAKAWNETTDNEIGSYVYQSRDMVGFTYDEMFPERAALEADNERLIEGVPYYVIEALEVVRSSGEHNMFDRTNVLRSVRDYSDRAHEWIDDNSYGDALNALGVGRGNQQELTS